MDEPFTADPALDEARALCRQHGYFFTPVKDWEFVKEKNRSDWVYRWVLYRAVKNGKPVRLGKCGTPARLLEYLKRQIKKWGASNANHAHSSA